jgi:phage terminase small subunit
MAPRKRKPPTKSAPPRVKTEALEQELSVKQMRFAHEYLIDLNATQAAIRAGYSPDPVSAAVEGSRQLRNAKVAKTIDELMQKNPGVTRQRIVDELAKIAFADPRAYVEWGTGTYVVKSSADLSDNDAAAISEVGIDASGALKIKLSDKQAALDKLMRVLGGYRDKVALTDPDGGPLTINIIKGIAE